MFFCYSLISFLLIFHSYITCLANSDRPRGVSLTNGPFYSDPYWFTCLDGSKKLPKNKVNDDYCDCEDGTDEPGTSACPQGKFHCNNRGYRPMYIPSSRVNDGLCDCCDTSDEYAGIGVQLCVNTCKELGKQEMEEKQKERVIQNRGFELRKEYIQQGQEIKKSREQDLQVLKAEQEKLEEFKDQKQRVKEEVEVPEKEAKEKHQTAWNEEKERRRAEREKAEAAKAFTELDINQDGMVSAEEIQLHTELDPDKTGEFTAEEATTLLNGVGSVDLGAFVTNWNKLKDSYEFASEQQVDEDRTNDDASTEPPPVAEPPSEDDDEDADNDEDDDFDEDEDAAFDEEEEDYDEEYDDDDYPEDYDDEDPAKMRDLMEQRRKERHERREKGKKQSNDEDEGMPPYDDATQELIRVADAARAELDEVASQLKNFMQNVTKLEKDLGVDLGPEQEFQPLQNQCYDFTDREYRYRLCAFEKATQSPKNGGAETSLGKWGEWAGPPEDKYSAMKYTGGQSCWNGPNRSTLVKLKCGIVNELMSAVEPEKCVYEFEFKTPAVCTKKIEIDYGNIDEHDEL